MDLCKATKLIIDRMGEMENALQSIGDQLDGVGVVCNKLLETIESRNQRESDRYESGLAQTKRYVALLPGGSREYYSL